MRDLMGAFMDYLSIVAVFRTMGVCQPVANYLGRRVQFEGGRDPRIEVILNGFHP